MRKVMLGAAVAAMVLAGAALFVFLPSTSGGGERSTTGLNAVSRSYTSGNFALDLGGVRVGSLRSVDGGAISAEVISGPQDKGGVTEKHIGPPVYEPFVIETGPAMAKKFYDWVAASWSNDPPAMDGAISALDFQGVEKETRSFLGGRVTESTLPGCDSAAKEPATLRFQLRPEMIKVLKGSGRTSATAAKSEQMLLSNCRLTIGGIDTTKVTKVEAFTVKQKVADEAALHRGRAETPPPGAVEIPNLVVTLAQASAASWYAWHDTFVVKGNNGQDQEKSGSFVYLAPDLQKQLVKVDLAGCGIFRIAPDATSSSSGDQIARVKAELYCEQMKFTAPGTAA